MGSIPVANPAPMGWRPPFIIAALAAVAALLVALVVFAWPEGPDGTAVGRLDEFRAGQPVHLEDQALWVVRGVEDRFYAFSDDDPRIAGEHDCRVEWDASRVMGGEQGVFETCAGYFFHPGGPIPVFPGVAPDGPSFYPASVNAGNVVVNFDEPYCNTRGIFYPGPCLASLADAGAGTIAPQPVIVPLGD